MTFAGKSCGPLHDANKQSGAGLITISDLLLRVYQQRQEQETGANLKRPLYGRGLNIPCLMEKVNLLDFYNFLHMNLIILHSVRSKQSGLF